MEELPSLWYISVISLILQWLYSPLLGPDLLFSFVIIFIQMVGLVGRVISPSQGRYLHTEQHKHRTNSHTHMPWVGFEPTILVSKRAKCVHALDRAATVIGNSLSDIFRNQAINVTIETTPFRFLEQFCDVKYISRCSPLEYDAMQSDM
jgi:hypothetical protein